MEMVQFWAIRFSRKTPFENGPVMGFAINFIVIHKLNVVNCDALVLVPHSDVINI